MTSFRRRKFHYSAPVTSLIQIVSDVLTIFSGLYLTRLLFDEKFMYQDLNRVLASIIAFQMIGSFTDFYRSWRGVRLSYELKIVIKSWILTILMTFGFYPFSMRNMKTLSFFRYGSLRYILGLLYRG